MVCLGMVGPAIFKRGAGIPRRFLFAAAVMTLAAGALLGWAAPPSPRIGFESTVGESGSPPLMASAARTTTLDAASPGAEPSSALTLGIHVAPSAICVSGGTQCAAGTDTARVTLTAGAGGTDAVSWPGVQIAFVLETTLYDGVYDALNGPEVGSEPCANSDGWHPLACEESNGVPFFAANAQAIANAIAAENPRTQVSFALVDYFGTGDDWNDGEGFEYHVDLPNFVPAAGFGAAVDDSLSQGILNSAYEMVDSDFADNFLHSSSITALYGTIQGSGLDWSANTHHVIVWMGSTAPRDPSYPENYCVSAAGGAPDPARGSCYGGTCEPAFPFPGDASPNCEGWVESRNGNATDSIARLAQTAPQCTDSLGGVCTIDAIDYWDTPTDPYSEGWPAGSAWTSIGGSPGGPVVLQNTANVLNAGCAIAAATGGTWDGPSFWSCPNGQAGTLQYVGPEVAYPPNTVNPTLFTAVTSIGFGPVAHIAIASATDRPLFTYVPYGNIGLAVNLEATAACEADGGPFNDCQLTPSVLHAGGVTYLGWNWSLDPSTNRMFVGDEWTASFNIVATAPPYRVVPADACVTAACLAAGSGPVGTLYSWASYVPSLGAVTDTASFPVATVDVEISSAGPLGIAPSAAPPSAPSLPPATPPTLPSVQVFGPTPSFGFGQVSFPAVAAGFLGAGFLRISLKHKPMAIRLALKSGRPVSKFEADRIRKQLDLGYLE